MVLYKVSQQRNFLVSSGNRALYCMNTELHLVVVLVNLNLKALTVTAGD